MPVHPDRKHSMCASPAAEPNKLLPFVLVWLSAVCILALGAVGAMITLG